MYLPSASGVLTATRTCHDQGTTMDDTACPEPGCTLPAEILDRTLLASTDGPIEHARVMCPGGHGFLMPTELLVTEPVYLRRTLCPATSRRAGRSIWPEG
jgi:hypothetical protein